MWFLHAIKSSVYDPLFYSRIREKRGSSAFGYFALLVFVFAFFASISPLRGIATFIFQSSEKKDAVRQEVLAVYPDELVLTTKGGKVSMNQPSPYTIPVPMVIQNESTKNNQKVPKNLIVINTNKPIGTDDFAVYDTFAVLSADSIGIFDQEKGKMEIQSLEKILNEPYTLDKTQFISFVAMLEKILKVVGVTLLFLLPFFVFFGMMLWYVIYLLFGALIIWIAAKLRGANWDYKTAYKAGLYLMTLPIICVGLMSFISSQSATIPFLFTGILFLATLININKEEKQEELPVVTATTETVVDSTPEIK